MKECFAAGSGRQFAVCDQFAARAGELFLGFEQFFCGTVLAQHLPDMSSIFEEAGRGNFAFQFFEAVALRSMIGSKSMMK